MNPAIWIVAGVLLLFGSKIELPSFLQRKPPTAQLAAAEQQLQAAKAAQAKAEAALEAARVAEADKTRQQLDYAQQMSAGASGALAKVPTEHQTPEVKLAVELSSRANAGLEAARGKLPDALRTEIDGLIGQALSAVEAERDAYKAALAVKDAQLQVTIADKAKIAAEIPKLEATVKTKDAEVQVVAAKVETKQAEVVAYADKFAAERAKAGTLDAYAGKLVWALIILGVLYFLIHFGLPSLAQEFPAKGWLQGLNKTAKSITSAHL